MNTKVKGLQLNQCLGLIKPNRLMFAADVELDEVNGAPKSTGTTTSTTSNKLVDSGANFVSDDVEVGDEVYNSTDQTFAFITAIDNGTTLSLSADIFTSGESYSIQGESTHDPDHVNMGSVDEAELDPVANPVVPGDNTFEKFHRLHIVDMAGSSLINNLKIWRTGALGGSAEHRTNVITTSYARMPYTMPTDNESSLATQTMPTSEPGSANLGIDGSLSGERDSEGFSDMHVHQILTDSGDTEGSTSTLNHQYSEVA